MNKITFLGTFKRSIQFIKCPKAKLLGFAKPLNLIISLIQIKTKNEKCPTMVDSNAGSGLQRLLDETKEGKWLKQQTD